MPIRTNPKVKVESQTSRAGRNRRHGGSSSRPKPAIPLSPRMRYGRLSPHRPRTLWQPKHSDIQRRTLRGPSDARNDITRRWRYDATSPI
ncbi:hypothetical protein KC347_g65 [Hortaea werneckii]|nr:hypothetical protein KC347_g65 [Hortaea werneckii]